MDVSKILKKIEMRRIELGISKKSFMKSPEYLLRHIRSGIRVPFSQASENSWRLLLP